MTALVHEEPPPTEEELAARPPLPPHNLEAEEGLLGTMLLSRAAIDDAQARLIASDFYKPAHAAIYDAICDLHDHGQPVDPGTVSEELRRLGSLDRLGGRRALLRLQSVAPISANAGHYTGIVLELSSRRRLIGAADNIRDLAYNEMISTPSVLLRSHELISAADLPLGGQPSPNVEEFLSIPHEFIWVLPDLLEVGERLLLVAPEKLGKSTLLRQVALCASQGLDPFRFHDIPRINVALFDFENPDSLIRRKLRPLTQNCANTLEVAFEPDRLRIESRMQGVDLTERGDEMWLFDRMAANVKAWDRAGYGASQRLVIIGPVYKMLNDEDDRREVANLQHVLDRLRSRFRCALIMETHAPQESFAAKAPPRSLRPYGARRWLRWPEFCRAIEPGIDTAPGVCDFYDVQGARDERAWPWRLQRGAGRWPWSAHEASTF